jgi:hypothetical protein
MGVGGAIGIWASSSVWWTVGFQLESVQSLSADLGGIAGVATPAGRVTAVASLVALMSAAAALGTLRVRVRRRLGVLAIIAGVVVATAAVVMAVKGDSFAAERADLAAGAQDMSEAQDLADVAREFAPNAELSLEADMSPALVVLLVASAVVGVGGVLLVIDPLATRPLGGPASHP